MMKNIVQTLSKLNPLLVSAMMFFIIMLILFEGWILVLRKPYTEYKQIVASKEALSLSVQVTPNQSNELQRITSELKQLSEQLSGELQLPVSDDKIAASLMASLDQSATTHHVTLASLKPKEKKQVSVFEEVSFEVSAKGTYLQLCAWMLDFAKTLGNSATVSDFEMKSVDEGKQVALVLNIALYRPLKLNEVPK
jgi:Tfp pilus assembly protein PilO